MSFVRSGLRDLSVSRSTFSWGIPVPDDPKHVIYVWLDALANYITALGYGSDDTAKYDKYWPADVQMIGKEIVRFHCVYWPAFLMAAGLPLPQKIMAHGWLLFEESKMSKSRGNIVRTETILDVLGSDALRYFLLREIVFGQDGSFSFDALVQRYNADLANGLGNLASRTLTMITRYFKGEVPYPSRAATLTAEENAIADTARQDDRGIQHAIRPAPVFTRLGSGVEPGGSSRQVHRRESALGAGREAGRRKPLAPGHHSLYQRGGPAHRDCARPSRDSRSHGENLETAGTGRYQKILACRICSGDSSSWGRSSAKCSPCFPAPTKAQLKGCRKWKSWDAVLRLRSKSSRREEQEG